jgi:hypothetical protein
VVREAVGNWAHHISEDVLSNKVYRVLNNNDSEVDELMHDESSDGVIVVEVGLSEVNISAVNDWIKITMLIQYEVSLEVNFEVLEDQLDVAVVGKEPEVDILLSIDLPMFDKSLMSVKFPAVKHWEIDAKQDVNFWFLPDYSNIQLIFKDFKLDFETDLQLDEHGYLDPIVYSADIHFGESYLYHDNPITAFIMHQFIYFGIVIIENSVYFVGQYIFTNMMGPVMDSFLNHYMFPFAFPTLVRGQNSWDIFTLDFRNTQSPYIGEGWIDFFLSGELLYAGNGCEMAADNLEFSVAGSTMSQLVISESAATCIANNVAKSHLGHIVLNSQTVSDLWAEPDLNFTTSTLGKHFPVLEKKLGKDKELNGYATFKDIGVIFGSFDTDVIISYTICFSIRLAETGKEVIYDELKMVTSAKMHAENDMVYITLLKNKLFIDNQYG